MKANMKLEPGVKALVIGYKSTPRNLGKVVTLVKFLKAGEMSQNGLPCQCDLWMVEGENLSQVTVNRNTGEITGQSSGHAYTHISAKYLMPIRPEEDPLEVEVEKTNAALV